MPIQNVVINTVDVRRSVDFYTKFLDAEVVGEPSSSGAVLNLLTATIELRRARATMSTWVADDLQKGFRHVGFNVVGPGNIDGLSAVPGADDVFVDPDGFPFTAADSRDPQE